MLLKAKGRLDPHLSLLMGDSSLPPLKSGLGKTDEYNLIVGLHPRPSKKCISRSRYQLTVTLFEQGPVSFSHT